MKRPVFYFIMISFVLQNQCQQKPTAPEIIPTTVGKGSGGNIQLEGKIVVWLSMNNFIPVTNVNLYVLDSKAYSDTLAYLFVNSTNATFKISDLPKDTVDIILAANHILPQKWYDFELNEQHRFSTFRVFKRDLQENYSPVFWLIARYDSDIDEIESTVKKTNCHIDTIIVKENADKRSKQMWFLLFSDDEQPIPEKLETFIFLQPVLYLWGYAHWQRLP